MKLSLNCYECLKRLIRQAADLATNDIETNQKAITEGTKILDRNFSENQVSIVVATQLHNAIKMITKNPDPFRVMKDTEIIVARELFHEINNNNNSSSFAELLRLAVLGNAIDFFRPIKAVKQDMRQNLCFAVDTSGQFKSKIKSARKIVYLADNAGEAFFDLPLVKWMERFAHVTYVVKSAPVQNDITVDDLERTGLASEFIDVQTTGTATPGIDFNQASANFKRLFTDADLIVAKGMGYYESLSELPADGRTLYCLKAKCQPVADSIGVSLNSNVALFN